MRNLKEDKDRDEHIWAASLQATTSSRVLEFPRRWVNDLVMNDDSLRAAVCEMQIKEGWKARFRQVRTKIELQKQVADLEEKIKHLEYRK
jgi:hypothetical protein